jgi:N-acetylglucosamine transport system permease protein
MRHGRAPFIFGFLVAPYRLLIYVIVPWVQAAYISVTDTTGFSPEYSFVGFANYLSCSRRGISARDQSQRVILTVYPIVTILWRSSSLHAQRRRAGYKAGMRGVLGSSVYKFISSSLRCCRSPSSRVIWSRVSQSNDGGWSTPADLVHDHTGGAIGVRATIRCSSSRRATRAAAHHRLGRQRHLRRPGGALCLLLVAIWGGVGFYLILSPRPMQSIPKDIFEAATLDGSSRVQTFFRVTLPLLRDHVFGRWGVPGHCLA